MSSEPELPNNLTPQVLAAMNNMAMKAHSAHVVAGLPEGASMPTCHTAEAQAHVSRIIQRELEDKDAEIGRLRARAEAAEAALQDIFDVALVDGFPESTPNAVGGRVSAEPTPLEIVEHLRRKYDAAKQDKPA